MPLCMSMLHWASVSTPYVKQNSSDGLLDEAAPTRSKTIDLPFVQLIHDARQCILFCSIRPDDIYVRHQHDQQHERR